MNGGAAGVNPAFEDYYYGIYGGRWKRLRESLLQDAASVPYTEALSRPYRLDRASVLAASSLRIKDNASCRTEADGPQVILDACAAPGGKTLVLASRMAEGAEILANEISPDRRRRLIAVLDNHLPPEKRRRVSVSGFDAAALAGRQSERGRFCAVLLDAPCSSERHVIRDKRALAAWTKARPRFLAVRQWALLSAAFLLLTPGGSLVYVTCALNPEENDGTARKLMEKYGPAQGGTCIPDPPDFPEGEAAEYGRIILPDTCAGMGPLYVARWKKAGVLPRI